MGEAKFAQSQTSQACQATIEQCTQTLDQGTRVQIPGGVFEVQWSNEGKPQRWANWLFAEFLQTSGLFEHWLQSCPLRYSSPNPPKGVDFSTTMRCTLSQP